MNQKIELIYKSPNSMKKAEGGVKSITINGFRGKREYIIKADITLDVKDNQDTGMFLRINNDEVGDSYSYIEHIYGRFRGQPIHMANFRPRGIQGGLFISRTHANRKSNINIESKIYSTPSYPKISLQTTSPNFIISSHDNWIQQDVSSIYDARYEELKSMIVYTNPPANFYGCFKIYQIIDE